MARSAISPRLIALVGVGALAAGLAVPAAASAVITPAADTVAAQAAPQGLDSFYQQQLKWTTCETTMECTWLTVPRNYAKPSQQSTFRIRVIRARATGTVAQYQGTLMLNPGGPGGSGYSMIKNNVIDDKSLHAAYDFVSFDPRGVDRSAPVQCLTDKQQDALTFGEDVPKGKAQWQKVVDTFALGRFCKLNDPSYRFLDTASVARDIDILRAAIGDPVLNWFGFSYGTKLGQTYAELFPSRVRRMALDGVVPTSFTYLDEAKRHAKVEMRGLRHYLADCKNRDTCKLSKDPDTALQQIVSIMKKLRAHPVTQTGARGTGEINDSAFRSTVTSGIFGAHDYGNLDGALEAAMSGNYRPILYDLLAGRSQDGTYADHSNGISLFTSVKCMDSPSDQSLSLKKINKVAKRMDKINPVTGAGNVWSVVQCHDWPAQTTLPPAPFDNDKALPKILLVGSSHDVRTPLSWAAIAAKQIKKSSLIRTDNWGHTSYVGVNDCVISSVNTYLLKGRTPGKDVSCPLGAKTPVPTG